MEGRPAKVARISAAFAQSPCGSLTFSNLSLMGRGFCDVTTSAISLPMRKASSLVLPGR